MIKVEQNQGDPVLTKNSVSIPLFCGAAPIHSSFPSLFRITLWPALLTEFSLRSSWKAVVPCVIAPLQNRSEGCQWPSLLRQQLAVKDGLPSYQAKHPKISESTNEGHGHCARG
ncbi:hypothetical protein RYH73_18590 [Olivibacter sp. CPCC 100613]|uniref:hypothetical protein n=1 Tax=Olivibacter sp. CPCC 100613 TaxID=3079931 RepID=UPI002FFC5997